MFNKVKIDVVDFEKEARKRERKAKFRNGVNNTINWIENNKEILAIAIPVVAATGSGTAKIIKCVSKNVALNKEKKLKELFIYDRSLGKYLELKKPLSSSQMKSILERKENGEKLAIILQQMNLLK